MSSASSVSRSRLTGADAIRNRYEMSQSEYNFPRLFGNFAPAAWERFRPEEQDVQEWAREESRRFYHEVDRRVPFLRTFTALMRFADVRQGLEEQRAAEQTRVRAEATRNLEEAQASQRESVVYDKIVSELRTTWKNANMSDVRYFVNKYCWREHSRWWDAFQAEEDGEQGWVNQTAKVLTRSVGYNQNFALAAVSVWLEVSQQHYPERF